MVNNWSLSFRTDNRLQFLFYSNLCKPVENHRWSSIWEPCTNSPICIPVTFLAQSFVRISLSCVLQASSVRLPASIQLYPSASWIIPLALYCSFARVNPRGRNTEHQISRDTKQVDLSYRELELGIWMFDWVANIRYVCTLFRSISLIQYMFYNYFNLNRF